MKVILINEKKNGGGCEVYVKNLCKILRNKDISVLNVYLNEKNGIVENDEVILNLSTSLISKLSFSFKTYKMLRKILEEYRPDYVLVNNVFSSPLTIYAALHGEKNIQIVHDYSIVCPKSACITDTGFVCKGIGTGSCLFSCTYHKSKIILMIKMVLMKLVKILQRRVVKKYISPSRKLAEYIKADGLFCTPLPNPQYLEVVIEKKYSLNRRFVYIGGLNKNKGLYDMLPAFNQFLKNERNAKLDIYGSCSTNDDYEFIKRYCNKQIEYHGHVAHSEVKNILRDAYALLVPSYWMENYPTTILEGFANRVLCIGSDRGGIPELLEDGRGICFAYGQPGLVEALKKANSISEAEYKQMTDKGVNYIRENNLPDIYFKRLNELLKMN